MPIVRPKPRQVSHAPSGELNENMLGSGSRYSMSQPAQCSVVEKRFGDRARRRASSR